MYKNKNTFVLKTFFVSLNFNSYKNNLAEIISIFFFLVHLTTVIPKQKCIHILEDIYSFTLTEKCYEIDN